MNKLNLTEEARELSNPSGTFIEPWSKAVARYSKFMKAQKA
jgi:hypothetical protein